MHFRTALKKAKGMGASHEGSNHWLMQRITAVFLLPLAFWLVSFVMRIMLDNGYVSDYIVNPISVVIIVMFICISLYHGYLGMRVIIEDYVKCTCMKWGLLLSILLCCIFTAILLITAVLYIHLDIGIDLGSCILLSSI